MVELKRIEEIMKELLRKYHAESAVVFGSYARGDATEESDIDVIIYGGDKFKKTDIFILAEDFRELIGKDADVFEISEVNQETFYNNILQEGIRIA